MEFAFPNSHRDSDQFPIALVSMSHGETCKFDQITLGDCMGNGLLLTVQDKSESQSLWSFMLLMSLEDPGTFAFWDELSSC